MQHCTPRILPDREENRKAYKSAVYCAATRPLKPGAMSVPGARAGWEMRLERLGPRELGGRASSDALLDLSVWSLWKAPEPADMGGTCRALSPLSAPKR